MGNRVNMTMSCIAGGDAALRHTSTGKTVATVRAAVNYPTGDGKTRPVWYQLAFWGEKRAQAAVDRIKKGYHLVVESDRFELNSWKTQSGEDRHDVVVTCHNFEAHPPTGAPAQTSAQPNPSVQSNPILDIALKAISEIKSRVVQPEKPVESAAPPPAQPVVDPVAYLQQTIADIKEAAGITDTKPAENTASNTDDEIARRIAELERGMANMQAVDGSPFS